MLHHDEFTAGHFLETDGSAQILAILIYLRYFNIVLNNVANAHVPLNM